MALRARKVSGTFRFEKRLTGPSSFRRCIYPENLTSANCMQVFKALDIQLSKAMFFMQVGMVKIPFPGLDFYTRAS